MKKYSILIVAVIVLIALSLAARNTGVTNFDSIHLSDSGGTATPVLLVNQTGTGKVAEFQDGGTPVVSINNGGGLALDTGGLTITAGAFVLGQQSETVTATWSIAPTSPYVVMTSNTEYTSSTTVAIITTTATAGQVLVLLNGNASDVLNLDGTGGTVECKANIAIGAGDTVTLIYESTDAVWYCLSNRDNS